MAPPNPPRANLPIAGGLRVMPLVAVAGAALLAIGSPDAERFHPTMSTEFLARIGDLVNEAIGTA